MVNRIKIDFKTNENLKRYKGVTPIIILISDKKVSCGFSDH